jgi:hypothetical protein
LVGVIAGILIAGVVYATTGFSVFGRITGSPTASSDAGNAALIAKAYGIIGNIWDGDFAALSQVVHPEYGVVFSPYATINLSTNKCFQAEQIAGFGTDTQLYVWGVYTSNGEPIELTPAEYFAEFVSDKDYPGAAIVGVNRIVRSGNALDNMTEVFQDAQFVDFYTPGGDNGDGDDNGWCSLRLGFEEYDGSLRLTVILHSQWTE